MQLSPLTEPGLRWQVFAQTFLKAARISRRATPPLPDRDEPGIKALLSREIFLEPLNLMLSAVVALDFGVLAALSRPRIELALEIAEKELHRIGRFARRPESEAERHILRHLAACATLERGFTLDAMERGIAEELAALKRSWSDGEGDLAHVLRLVLPGEQLAVAPVEPDFVGEAAVLKVLAAPTVAAGPDRWREWCAVVERCGRRDSRSTAATLLHAFQNFGSREDFAEPLLAATDALIRIGVTETEPQMLMAIESALPDQTVKLRERASEVTRHLYVRAKSAVDSGRQEVIPDLGRVSNNLAARLSELGRRAEAPGPAEEAVTIYRALAAQNPDAFQPALAGGLNNLANRLSELGRRAEALGPAEEAVTIYRALAAQNPDAFQPDLARSLGALGRVLEEDGRLIDAFDSFRSGIDVLTAQFLAQPRAFVALMTARVRDYLRVAATLQCEPDSEGLSRVLALLASLVDDEGSAAGS